MSVPMRSGELFAGVGGLSMAVDEVFESTPAWFVENEPAPSKVLAHHYPDVPNLGDVRTVDWAAVPHVDVLAGGFPCQDVSLAGRRRGMKEGTRSGLWSEFARAIDIIRPEWVVIENVRGLRSARADSEVEPCPWCVGVGDDEYHLRALDAVLADLTGLGYDATWAPLRASDVGAPHGRYRFFILASATDADRAGLGSVGRVDPVERDIDGRGGSDGARDDVEPASHLKLLPTPRTTDMNGAGAHGTGGADLRTTIALLPTPQVADATGGHASRSGVRRSERLLPGAAMDSRTDWGPYTPAVERWEAILGRPAPSPVRMDGKGGKARLNAELPEWMMGWPAGWVTDPQIGLTRSEQLKCVGNGVVTRQAVAAIRSLLTRVLAVAA